MVSNSSVSDFSKGSVASNILRLAIPMTFAQLINVLYNVVDRIYLGHMPGASAGALAGVGLAFPIITMITAFANLFGFGGTPLFSIERGKNNTQNASRIMGATCALLLGTGVILSLLCFLLKKPLLYAFGASSATFPFANDYLTIYLCGTLFVMLSLGMNGFINAQGFGRIGMMTVLLGAAVNIALDPLFIFYFDMGVRGAALATVLSQFLSATWAMYFLCRKRAVIRLRFSQMRPTLKLTLKIIALGTSGFIMSVTNGLVQIACTSTLQQFGGDLYVSVMTIVNSVREVAVTPINGVVQAAQPILGYNYGAREYGRVRKGIRFLTILSVCYTLFTWLVIFLFPQFFAGLFTSDAQLIAESIPAMHIYFFGIFMMALQFSGQSAAVALGRSKQSIFFSLFRKVVIVIPLTLWLPHVASLGVKGVFLAEPISNFIGGAACYITMLLTIGREMNQKESKKITQN
ncbi:MATE family efflux transporter [uncultured Ruthenibacterium sp.]|uniref:MATE family efflux transporter n=1 Tax=uncultured Ruthenibacterium sp. TaxID=1905347 RepID=UPI00349E854B